MNELIKIKKTIIYNNDSLIIGHIGNPTLCIHNILNNTLLIKIQYKTNIYQTIESEFSVPQINPETFKEEHINIKSSNEWIVEKTLIKYIRL